MMAASKQVLDQEPSEIEVLLPWHAAGTLNARDARRVDEALARDPELARQYAVIREEYAETISLNESLGAPPAVGGVNQRTRLIIADVVPEDAGRYQAVITNLAGVQEGGGTGVLGG